LLSDGHFLRVAGASKLIWASLSGMFSVSPSFSSKSSYEVSSPLYWGYRAPPPGVIRRPGEIGPGPGAIRLPEEIGPGPGAIRPLSFNGSWRRQIRHLSGLWCQSARGPDADRRAKLLIHLAVEGALLGAYSQSLSLDFHFRGLDQRAIDCVCGILPVSIQCTCGSLPLSEFSPL
jgi:hypothetical protein